MPTKLWITINSVSFVNFLDKFINKIASRNVNQKEENFKITLESN